MNSTPITDHILVTGGAGFIGSNLLRLLCQRNARVVNVDCLTYAGNMESLQALQGNQNYNFERSDICDRPALDRIFDQYRPGAVLHLAAESHVDRSIDAPGQFVQTNVVGTYTLLESARGYFETLSSADRDRFRFITVSTDEVFGSLGEEGHFSEDSPYDPSSPYSATKAAADHLSRAYQRTYGLPTIVTNCSNNYGPFQFPEKLIPLMITRALSGQALPVYGHGNNMRDWLYVTDHCEALWVVLERGHPGQTYTIGGDAERSNIDVVKRICALLENLCPAADRPQLGGRPYESLIQFVEDRPGHDFRYAIDATRIQDELGWRAREDFDSGLEKTLRWYLGNQEWTARVLSGEYRKWIDKNYGSRLS